MARKRGPAHNSVHSAAPGPSAHGAETRRDTPRAWQARPRSHAEAAGRQPSPRATSLQAAFRHDSHKLRRMELQVVFHLPRRLFGIPRAYPHAKRPCHHHRRHHVQVAPPRKRILVVAVVALAVVDLDIPMCPDNFRKLLRRARVGVGGCPCRACPSFRSSASARPHGTSGLLSGCRGSRPRPRPGRGTPSSRGLPSVPGSVLFF